MFNKLKNILTSNLQRRKTNVDKNTTQEPEVRPRKRIVLEAMSVDKLNRQRNSTNQNNPKRITFRQTIYHNLSYFHDHCTVSVVPKNRDSVFKSTSFIVADISAFLVFVEHQKQMDEALHKLKTIVDDTSNKELFETV